MSIRQNRPGPVVSWLPAPRLYWGDFRAKLVHPANLRPCYINGSSGQSRDSQTAQSSAWIAAVLVPLRRLLCEILRLPGSILNNLRQGGVSSVDWWRIRARIRERGQTKKLDFLARISMKLGVYLVPVVIVLLCGEAANAQLFGSRSVGQTLRRRVGPGSTATGELRGNERFLRGNRGRSDFIGSDQGDAGGFVGSDQARGTGTVAAAAASVRERKDRTSQINRPIDAPAKGEMYAPRLRIGFTIPRPQPKVAAHRLAEELASSSRFSPACRFEVSVEGQTAILRGEATSARERDLAQLVVLLSPGISQVSNEVRVRDRPLSPPPAPSEGSPGQR